MNNLAVNHQPKIERLGNRPIFAFPGSLIDILSDFAKRHFRPPKCLPPRSSAGRIVAYGGDLDKSQAAALEHSLRHRSSAVRLKRRIGLLRPGSLILRTGI